MISGFNGFEISTVTTTICRFASRAAGGLNVCVASECLIGKQKKPILFKVTEPGPSSIPYR